MLGIEKEGEMLLMLLLPLPPSCSVLEPLLLLLPLSWSELKRREGGMGEQRVVSFPSDNQQGWAYLCLRAHLSSCPSDSPPSLSCALHIDRLVNVGRMRRQRVVEATAAW
jgi:hypothetical protein